MFGACGVAGADLREVRPFGEELPQESVEVLVGASLPRPIGLGEVDREPQPLFRSGKGGRAEKGSELIINSSDPFFETVEREAR